MRWNFLCLLNFSFLFVHYFEIQFRSERHMGNYHVKVRHAIHSQGIERKLFYHLEKKKENRIN
jgi:hypothetical protein